MSKHSKEKCIDSAKKYESKTAWFKGDTGAYNFSKENGFFEECTKHMPANSGRWSPKKCIENAAMFADRGTWAKESGGAYQYALKNDIYDECVAHMPKHKTKWTKEKCMANAAKYTTKSEWRKNEPSAYQTAHNHGYINECVAHMLVASKKLMQSAANYSFLIDWSNNKPEDFLAAKESGVLVECTEHMNVNARRTKTAAEYTQWNKDVCIASASKYSDVKSWSKNENGAYLSATRGRFIDECKAQMATKTKQKVKQKANTLPDRAAHMDKNIGAVKEFEDKVKSKVDSKTEIKCGKWSIYSCLEDSAKYTSLQGWIKIDNGAYTYAKANNILDECVAHMNGQFNEHSVKKCFSSAKRFNCAISWRRIEPGVVAFAKNNGFYDACSNHMKPDVNNTL